MYLNRDIEEKILKENNGNIKEKCRYVAELIASDFCAEKDDILKITKRIERLWEKRRKLQKSNPEELELWRKETFDFVFAKPVDIDIGGRPRKRLSDSLSQKTENRIRDDLLSQIESIADTLNIAPKELLQKLNERSLLKWRCKNEISENKMPVEDACSLIYNVNFSLSQYQKLRMHLREHSIEIPTRNEIGSYKKTLICEHFVEATKTSCQFDVLVVDTVRSLIALSSPSLKPNDRVHVDAKLGIDGSGSHQIRHQLAENDEPGNDNDGQNCETSYIGTFW